MVADLRPEEGLVARADSGQIVLQRLKGQPLCLYRGSGSRVSLVWARDPQMRAGRWMRLTSQAQHRDRPPRPANNGAICEPRA